MSSISPCPGLWEGWSGGMEAHAALWLFPGAGSEWCTSCQLGRG